MRVDRASFNKGFFLLILYFFVNSAIGGPDHEPLPVGITVSLSLVAPSQVDNSVNVDVTYTNTSNTEIVLNYQNSVLSGAVYWDMFDVYFGDLKQPYNGPVFRIAPKSDSDNFTILPGASVTKSVRLDLVYSFESSGIYSIAYKTGSVETSNTLEFAFEFNSKNFKQPPNFNQCSVSQTTVIDRVLSIAESYAVRARNDMAGVAVTEQSRSPRYREWFGVYTAENWNQVQSNFVRIADSAINRTITFDCACEAGGENTIAYIFREQPFRINICPIFWRLRDSGTDSKAGTIVHELSHFNETAGTNDFAYGLTDARNLAGQRPNDAIDNAENYQFFSENPGNLAIRPAPSRPSPPNAGNPSEPANQPQEEGSQAQRFLPAILPLLIEDPGGFATEIVESTPSPEIIPPTFGKATVAINVPSVSYFGEQARLVYTEANSNFILPRFSRTPRHSIGITIEGISDDLKNARVDNWSIGLGFQRGQEIQNGRYPFSTHLSSEGNFMSIGRNGNNCQSPRGYFEISNLILISRALNETKPTRFTVEFVVFCGPERQPLRGKIEYDDFKPSITVGDTSVAGIERFMELSELSTAGGVLRLRSEDGDGYLEGVNKLFATSKNASVKAFEESDSFFGRTRAEMIFQIASNDEFWQITLERGDHKQASRVGRLSKGVFRHAVNRANTIAPLLRVERILPSRSVCDASLGEFRIYNVERSFFAGPPSTIDLEFKVRCDGFDGALIGNLRLDQALPFSEFEQPQAIEGAPSPTISDLSINSFNLVDTESGQQINILQSADVKIGVRRPSQQIPGIESQIFSTTYNNQRFSLFLSKRFDFDDVENRGRFVVGRYSVAVPAPPRYQHGLVLRSGNIECRPTYGAFNIYEVSYDGDTLTRLLADFSQSCRGRGPIIGSLNYSR